MVGGWLGAVAHGVQNSVQSVPDVRCQRAGDPIVHPQAITPRVDEPGAPQVGEVTRRCRLRDVQTAVNVAHTDLIVGEQGQDAESGRIRQCRADGGDVGDGSGRE